MMLAKQPYLIRALNEWILDNHMTPHLLVNADVEGVKVPKQFIEDGKIVLNISPNSVRKLEIGNEFVLFSTRFGGNPFYIRVPVRSVLAIYAKENGMGMIFPEEEPGSDSEMENFNPEKSAHLKLVK